MPAPEHWDRLKELFDRAGDLTAEDQQRFLAELPAEDDSLRQELEAMLAADRSDTRSDPSPLAVMARRLAEEPAVDLAGRRVGSYRLLRILGEGGMGVVYLAERADDAYRQQVAVKLLLTSRLSEELRRRFYRERQALARLEHPHIARLLDGGLTDDGLPFLVMEFVDGLPIDRHCRERDLDIAGRLRLFGQVCRAVAHAHRNLIVHRDLKPSNIMVDREGVVKLLDFGVAKLLSGDEPGLILDPTITVNRALTPEFASPEQLRGDAVTTASDTYSLGVVLYVLLADALPYASETRSVAQFERLVRESEPARPSLRAAASPLPSVRLRASALRGDLDNIVRTALRKEPERRYATPDALREDVERFLEHRPVGAHADSLGYRARKFVRRHRLGVATTAAATLALAAGVGVALWQAREARLERDRARAEKARAEEMTAFLRSVLTSPDPVRGQGRRVTVAEVLDAASNRLGLALRGQPQAEAPLRETLGETYANLGLPEAAEREARRALALRGCTGTSKDVACAEASVALAHALSDQGQWSHAEGELRGVLDRTKSVAENADFAELVDLRGRALDELGVCLQNLGRGEEAIGVGREALALLLGRGVSPDIALASAQNDLGIALGNTGRFAEAEALHRESLGALRAVSGEDHPLHAQGLANLAGVVEMQGRLREAEPLYRQALEVLDRLLGEGHPRSVRTRISYANLFVLLGEPARGVPLGREALRLARQHLGAEDPTVAYAEAILATLLVAAGDGREAETHARAALASRRRMLPAGHWLIANTQALLGEAFFLQGRDEAAANELLAAYKVLLTDRGPTHEKTRLAATWLARLYHRRGDRARAESFARAAQGEAAS